MKLDGRTANWRATALELIPFAAPPLLAAGLALNINGLLFAALAVSLATGLGWWAIGRTYAAMFSFAIRGFVLLLLLWWGIGQLVSESVNEFYFAEEHDATATGEQLLAVAAAFFALSTIASAVAVAFVSRHRAAAGRMRPEA